MDEHLGGISVFNTLLPPNMGMEEEEGKSVEESTYVQLWPLSLFSFFPWSKVKFLIEMKI